MNSKSDKAADPSDQPSQVATPKRRPKFPRGPQLKVEVTREIMEHAKVRDSSHCMVAMAIRDVVPDAQSIAVDVQTIRFSDRDKGLRYTYLTPRQAQVAIIQFDQGVMPEPFGFYLRGAHVTNVAPKPKVQTPRAARTEAQKQAIAKAIAVRYGTSVRSRLVSGDSTGNVPRRVGGLTPPLSSFAKRREFGLRALKI